MASDLQLIVPNLHRRYSGVTATNRMVAPKLAKRFRAGWFGSDAPDGIARIGLADLLKLWRRGDAVIWHARRNNEMIVGVLLRALGWPLKLVFTSAAQRHHTWITRWRMPAKTSSWSTISPPDSHTFCPRAYRCSSAMPATRISSRA